MKVSVIIPAKIKLQEIWLCQYFKSMSSNIESEKNESFNSNPDKERTLQ